jgi:hypothetical protein
VIVESLKAQILDWEFGRGVVKSFIRELGEGDLDKVLPRNNLNTIRKQCEELIQVQSCYVKALETRRIQFHYEPLDDLSKDSLLEQMGKLDEMLKAMLEQFDGSEKIRWHGEAINIHQHISAMIGHEQMHIGQIIAFCYSCGIKIPKVISSQMSLNG